jgi:hypothetical protein
MIQVWPSYLRPLSLYLDIKILWLKVFVKATFLIDFCQMQPFGFARESPSSTTLSDGCLWLIKDMTIEFEGKERMRLKEKIEKDKRR